MSGTREGQDRLVTEPSSGKPPSRVRSHRIRPFLRRGTDRTISRGNWLSPRGPETHYPSSSKVSISPSGRTIPGLLDRSWVSERGQISHKVSFRAEPPTRCKLLFSTVEQCARVLREGNSYASVQVLWLERDCCAIAIAPESQVCSNRFQTPKMGIRCHRAWRSSPDHGGH